MERGERGARNEEDEERQVAASSITFRCQGQSPRARKHTWMQTNTNESTHCSRTHVHTTLSLSRARVHTPIREHTHPLCLNAEACMRAHM